MSKKTVRLPQYSVRLTEGEIHLYGFSQDVISEVESRVRELYDDRIRLRADPEKERHTIDLRGVKKKNERARNQWSIDCVYRYINMNWTIWG
jgi:hypothetical protein